MDTLNYNEKYEDLKKLEEYKVLNTYEKLMIMEMKIISESLVDISNSLKTDILDINYSKLINNEDRIIKISDIIYQIKEKI